MIRRPPRSTRTDTLFPYTTLFRSQKILWSWAPGFLRDQNPLRKPATFAPSASHRSEEHTSELQSLMRISYAVFCLKKKKPKTEATSTLCSILDQTRQIKPQETT